MKLRCDYLGKCKNPAFMEVDWDDKNGDWWWSNLCLPHTITELIFKRKHNKMGWCLSQVWYSHFWNSVWKIVYRILP